MRVDPLNVLLSLERLIHESYTEYTHGVIIFEGQLKN